MQDKIIIKGAREHNLKNVNLELPRNKMIVFTGLSGSGKSSLAFDTIFAEGQRRYIESLSAYARQFLGGLQKPDVDEIEGLSPAISIDQKAHSANPRSTVATITEIYDYLRVLFARVGEPHCPLCNGKIKKMTSDEIKEKILTHTIVGKSENTVTILSPVVRGRKGEYYQMLYDIYNSGYVEARIDGKIHSLREQVIIDKNSKHTIEIVIDKIFLGEKMKMTESELGKYLVKDKDGEQRLSEAIANAIELSNGLCAVIFPDKTEQIYSAKYACPQDGYSFPEIEPRLFSFNSPYGYCGACIGLGTETLFSETECPVCKGKRLNTNALSVKVAGKNIWEITNLTIGEAREFFANVEKKLDVREKEISNAVLKEILNRLQFMFDVGLHYLTLNRKAGTLSGGEAQRIRLASQVGTRLVGALYVLDEPTIGLHQRDNDKLVATLRNLCDVGNTIIVVEHDEDTILASDWVVDFGPGAGKHGGEIVFSGPLENLLEKKVKSLTGEYLRGEKKIALSKNYRAVDKTTPKIKIKGAVANNLKKINVEIPLRRFICLTGVSGSGKSTLMHDVLHTAVMNRLYRLGRKQNCASITGTEYLDRAIVIDQSPIGRTPRSNPATYTKAWDLIREIFSATEESRIRGFKVGRFSFNVPGGRCENCEGRGVLEIEMHFLPSVEIVCDVCKGRRFNQETLQVNYKKKNISDILNMTVAEAEEFFKDIPLINDKLKMLNEVGLDYLTLGQSATTLSGGEAQRIKLSRELSKHGTTKTLYLLDEPTVGLHYEDVRKLLEVLQR
ncbi:MAG: Excinuclease ABC, subunit A, partial [Candidatus Magasanikbacteria bacterium GW2011_GWC2_41_17]